jgi:hypothetical protein
MSSDFLVWRPGTMKDGICKLRDLEGVEDSFEIDEGVSRLDGWPEGASATMDARFPKDIGLADSLAGAGFVVVSGKVKALLAEAQANRVEMLPVRIVNHKGRTASPDYFVVNPLDVVDCVDVAASKGRWNALDPESLCGCDALVLREAEVPREMQIFRPKSWKNLIVVRRALADRMRAAGLTGLFFLEPSEYTGLV